MAAPGYSPGSRAAATPIAGIRAPENLESTRVKADVSDKIHFVQPNATPFNTAINAMRDKREVGNYYYHILEKDEYPRFATVASISGTTLTLGTNEGNRFPVNALLRNTRNGENVLVTTAAATSPTVQRAIGGDQADWDEGDTVVMLAVVNEDAATLGTIKNIAETPVSNYTQIVRRPFGWSGRDIAMELYGGNDVDTEARWAAVEFRKDIEYSLIFGKPLTQTGAGGRLQTFTGGVDYFIGDSFIWDLNGERPTELQFVQALEQAMRWGKGGKQNGKAQKWLFCSSRWQTAIEMFARDRLQTRVMSKAYGLEVGKFKTTHGMLNIVNLPILDYNDQDKAYLLDLNHIRYVYLQGRDSKLLKNREANDEDAKKWEYFADFGLELSLPEAHAKFEGLGE